MKLAFIPVVLSVLGGCGTYADSWGEPVRDLTDSGQTHSEAKAPANAHCEAVAHQRALDAKANEYDDDLDEKTYERLSYEDCVRTDAEQGQ
jgi:hypothetical protein